MNTDELIGLYLLAAAENYEARKDYSRSAVKRGNRAADELRRLATDIGRRNEADVRAFSRLLDDPRNGVDKWAAFHLLEVMTAPLDVVDRAFVIIERLAASDDLDAIGTRVRLKELRTQFGR